ncbi:MAG: O-antigen ligase family protein [Terracidiphilus sp.]
MGFFLSVLYLVTSYLTPATLFGPLAAYRVELILAAMLLIVSAPTLLKSFLLRVPQSLAMIGMMSAVVLSMLVALHWPGGAMTDLLSFLPNAFAFFVVCLHFNSKRRLQILAFMMLCVCLFVIAHGMSELHSVSLQGGPPVSDDSGDAGRESWNLQYPYLFPQANPEGQWIYRIRGLGEINDPNDFGQLIACMVPLMFIFWRAKKTLHNFFFVILPVGTLLCGAFLTHSRGALVALMAVAVVAARRRIGTLPAVLIAGVLFVAAMALHFTGGRAISASAGEDRTSLWGESMRLLKLHPLFGVGYGQLTDYLGHTAHNSVAVCAAETGMFGLYFWCLFLFPTLRDILTIASPLKVSDGQQAEPEEQLFPRARGKIESLDKAEVNRLGRLLVLSFTGFLVAGWFLSRAFVLTFFLLGGVAEVVFEMALRQGMVAPRMPLEKVLFYAGILSVTLIVLMYVMLRIVNLAH